jgi:uracil-DNA glycosylase
MIQSTNPEKIEQFKTLVHLFKEHHFWDNDWINPYQIQTIYFEKEKKHFETFCEKHSPIEVLNPWNWWYGNLDADILLIGQDWGAIDSNGGIGELFNKKEPSDTNKNLIALFKVLLGYDIDNPYSQIKNNKSDHKLFFTNAILGIRKGNRDSGKINLNVYKGTSVFLFSLINIIKPKCIIAMGSTAYEAIHHIYSRIHLDMPKPSLALRDLVQENGNYPEIGSAKLFVSYHCSKGSINRNRLSIDSIKKNWEEIKKHISK